MLLLDLPDHVFNWLARYFEHRGHATKMIDIISRIAEINASIIQGSVVGPPSFVIVASKHHFNLMTKYADDTYLMVGSRNVGTVIEEFSNIQAWASRNNLRIHPNKTKEMIVYRRRSKCVNPSAHPLTPGAERVDSLRGLGVVVTSHLTMRVHLDQILSSSASSIFALRKLRSHGLQASQLHLVARATTVASLLYASPAWWGFTSAEERPRLERLIARLRRGGYLPQDVPTFEELAGTADHQLFKSIITNPHHVLRRYFPEKKPSGYNLRPRVHNCELPVKDTQNFVPHTIYGELKLK